MEDANQLNINKDAGLKSKAITLGLAAALAANPAKAQFTKKLFAPIVEKLMGSHKIPELMNTFSSKSGVRWISKEHPLYAGFMDELKSSMNDTTLKFKDLAVDTAEAGKEFHINVFGTDEKGNITHRLFRREPAIKRYPHLINREQWVDEIADADARKFIDTRTKSLARR